MKPSAYLAVVFDLDGTAVDSKYNITALAQVYLEYFGKEPSQADLELTYGMTAKNCILHLGVKEEALLIFEKKWGEKIIVLEKTQAKLYDGIWQTMQEMHRAGIILGVNTSRRMDEVEPLRGGISEPFLQLCQVIVTCDKVAAPKPDPASMVYFLQETGLKAADVLFVGDSIFDSACAQSSGCDFALATWGAFQPETIPAKFCPQTPLDLLRLVGLS